MADTTRPQIELPTASGRFLLRLDPALHAQLREAAQRSGLSLNDLCIRRLSAPATDVGGPGSAIVTHAAHLFGDALKGVVAFGSWARDELASDSDVDVLVIVAKQVAITRDLYRRWDHEPMSWRSRDVDVHFAHQPTSGAHAGGMWIDIAIDGVVLYDRDLELSRTLADIRSRVASGELSRHYAHGQAYWVEGT
ncbi:MAG: toxin-antitoxin system HicB family antitoxin [Trueperaceae bacterium]